VALRESIAAALDEARARSLGLLDPLDEDDLRRQHSALMSPLVWDLAHVGNYEDLWLLRAVGAPGVGPQYDDIYDAFRHPRKNRPALPLLGPAGARQYLAEVRGRALDALDALERAHLDGDGPEPLLAGGFVYGMVVQHEHQHDETMLATLQLRGRPYAVLEEPAPEGADVDGMALVPAGPFVMGTDRFPWAYDNERPAHVVELPAFLIDKAPVRNRDYAAFIDAGGYERPELWSEEGWAWRVQEGLEAPQSWCRDTGDGCWWRVRFGVVESVPPDEPVQHVCWHEAQAYAAWAGKRLPTEAEWEKAAAGSPGLPQANLDQRRLGPSPVGGYGGASDCGCVDMLGNVWEWTASSFTPYPGFASFPYREYSEVFFGDDYKVLRGGSWATHPSACRVTFRNWDFPIRRQIFAGFRCAQDADG
jgi:iron(II)-dependent oxidoreductase